MKDSPVIVVLLASAAMVSAQEMTDIHGPKDLVEISVPKSETPWWVWAVVALGAVILILLVWRLARGKGESIPLDQIARKELDRLGREGGDMNATSFAESASGVLRRFIEGRFGLAAPKRTTEEFLQEATMGKRGLALKTATLRDFLRSCDMAKFAGSRLDAAQRDNLLQKARAFVAEAVENEDAV